MRLLRGPGLDLSRTRAKIPDPVVIRSLSERENERERKKKTRERDSQSASRCLRGSFSRRVAILKVPISRRHSREKWIAPTRSPHLSPSPIQKSVSSASRTSSGGSENRRGPTRFVLTSRRLTRSSAIISPTGRDHRIAIALFLRVQQEQDHPPPQRER